VLSRHSVVRIPKKPPLEESLLLGLNPEQLEVVQHRDGALLVGAVAGAGKTTALTRRIAYLVANGVDAERILAVTFSVKAANEMNDRLEQLLPDTLARVGTFHSLALQIIREEYAPCARWEIDDRDRYRLCVKDAIGYRGMGWHNADLTTILLFIELAKNACAPPGSEAAKAMAKNFFGARPSSDRTSALLLEAYERAEIIRAERQLLTYTDMLLEAWALLEEDRDALARWQSKWDFVLQDECQDENQVQRNIGSMLARVHKNYMVVGDPAQAIYGFRGSDPRGLLEFEQRWGARVVQMDRNYRSGRKIVDLANKTLAAMREGSHLGMRIRAERDIDGQIATSVFGTVDEEGAGIARIIMEQQSDGARWRDIVVLYRTNAQSRAIEERFIEHRIPYVVLGGTNFYDRKEVKDLLAYLSVAAGRSNVDDVRRCLNAPFRFLGRQFLDRVEREAGDAVRTAAQWGELLRKVGQQAGLQQRQRTSVLQLAAMIEAMASAIDRRRRVQDQVKRDYAIGAIDDAEMLKDSLLLKEEMEIGEVMAESAPHRLIENLLDETKYVQWITHSEGSESPENNRVSNIRELVRAAERFADVDHLLDYIEETRVKVRENRRDTEMQADRVTLMSIHRSKGLEWPHVFVVGCSDGLLPHHKADLDEERRLFYVAVTRARDTLTITTVMKDEKERVMLPSRFLSEAGLEVVHVERLPE
jgi:DNA helicase II / ATP-dependent DNA helicase PcrA